MVTVTSLPLLSSTLRPSASAYLRPSWNTWPISMPRAISSGPEPSGAGSPSRTVQASRVPSHVKSRSATRSYTWDSATFAPVIQRVPGTTRGSTK